MVIEQIVEEGNGADSEEDKPEILKKRRIIGREEDLTKMKDGLMGKEAEDSDLEEEGEEEELEDIEGIEEPAGRILHLHLLGRKAWLGQEATHPPKHQPGIKEKRKRMKEEIL